MIRPPLITKTMNYKLLKRHNVYRTTRCLALAFALFLAAAPSEAQTSVMTFNIRLDAASDGANAWVNRKQAVCDMLRYYSPDLLGMQEVCPNQLDDLKASLGQYEVLGVGRDDGKHKGEHSPIFFNKARFTLVKHGDFSLSETPETFGKKGWDASYNRVCTWAVLRDRRSGKKIAFFNTHLDNDGSVARREGIRLVLNRAQKYAPGLPTIITADYNCTYGEAPFTVLREKGMDNARDISPIVYGPSYSWHDYGRLPADERTLLDHVFVSHGVKAMTYRVIQDKPENVWLSDHYPIIVNIDYK